MAGFSGRHIGTQMLRDIIVLGISGKVILPLNSVGYTYLAQKYQKNIDTVDKDIQNSIAYAWENGNIHYLYYLFGYTVDENRGKPTNFHCIMTIIDKILTHDV